MNRLRTPALAVCTALLAFAGCGGGGSDEENAQDAVREVAEATSESDGEKFCGLLTKQLLEQSTGAEGDKAKDECRKQIDARKKSSLKVTKITKTEIDGDRAEVTAELEMSGRRRPQVFKLKKEDGDFKLTGARE